LQQRRRVWVPRWHLIPGAIHGAGASQAGERLVFFLIT
jgi:hypothetical protein